MSNSSDNVLTTEASLRPFLGQALSWVRWIVITATFMITLLWPSTGRSGYHLSLNVLAFAAYNLALEVARRRPFWPRLARWVPVTDLVVVAALYYFDPFPTGPMFSLFFLTVISAATMMTPSGAAVYTVVTALVICIIAPTMLAWDSTYLGYLRFASRLIILCAAGISTAFVTRQLIEQQARAEESQTQSIRLRELDRVRADFIAGISHDLRTPLTAIQASIGLLETSATSRLYTEEQELLRNARRNVERLGLLLDDLLTYNQLRAGSLHLQCEPTDLRSIVAATFPTIHPLVNQKGQVLEMNLNEPLPVKGDARRLEQVVVNLLSNANRHTPSGARIYLVGRVVGNEALLTISDNGPGIPVEELDKIFERFYRLRDSESGTGLGLAIAKDIVELHGGRLWADSVDGEGAAFHFALPVYREARELESATE